MAADTWCKFSLAATIKAAKWQKAQILKYNTMKTGKKNYLNKTVKQLHINFKHYCMCPLI